MKKLYSLFIVLVLTSCLSYKNIHTIRILTAADHIYDSTYEKNTQHKKRIFVELKKHLDTIEDNEKVKVSRLFKIFKKDLFQVWEDDSVEECESQTTYYVRKYLGNDPYAEHVKEVIKEVVSFYSYNELYQAWGELKYKKN